MYEEIKKEYPEVSLEGFRGIDLTGKKFNHWTVLYRTINNSAGQAFWICQCDCGNIYKVMGRTLRNGTSKQCRMCAAKNNPNNKNGGRPRVDLAGQKIGMLIVIKESDNTDKNRTTWLCKCDCGNEVVVTTDDLQRHRITSCQRCSPKRSNNERIMSDLLTRNNISFEIEQCIVYEKTKLYFDFVVNHKYIIEYDGEQHFHVCRGPFFTEGKFKICREHDLLKNKYCFDNNIPLIRIPYDTDYTINDLKLETTRFLLTPENEKDYYESRK